MMKLNRIGYKLGAAGLLGVVLTAGMIVNQMMSEAAVEAANSRAATQQAIAANALEARVSLRRMQLGVRDIRLAKSPQDIEKASAAVAEGFAASTKGMDTAISKAVRPENKERFEKAKSLVNTYEAGAGEIKRSQLRIFEITAKRNEVSAEWGKTFTALTALPALTAAANRFEIEKTMYEADSHFNGMRAATWRFAQTEEDSQKAAIEKRSAALTEAMGRLKALASDKSMSAAVEKLASLEKPFGDLTTEVILTETAKKEQVS